MPALRFRIRPSRVAACLTLALAASGCTAERSPSDPDGPIIVAPIQIDSVDVRVAESAPVQVFAHVTGVIGDGCSRLLPLTQRRSGNTVTIEIQRERPRDAVCIQIAQLYDETIRLEGEFPPGSYSLQVNALTRAFSVP